VRPARRLAGGDPLWPADSLPRRRQDTRPCKPLSRR
jgi:hypothetical protein